MDYIDGQAVIEKYTIPTGELVKAILDGLPAYDRVTGERFVDRDSLIAYPKYKTEKEAAEAYDLIAAGMAASKMRRGEKPFTTYAPGGAGGIDGIVRRNFARLFLENSKVYGFPAGQQPPNEPWCPFPLRFETFSREYSKDVTLGVYEGESTKSLYEGAIRAMIFPVLAVEKRFGKASADTGLDIRHVPLTPGQDWLGNPDPLLNRKQIARAISVFDLLSRWSGASGESMGALSERLVRFIKHGALHLFEPQQKGPRILYAPSTKDAAAIEIDCAAASLNGWTEGSQAVNDLSGLFADMAEVEALEAQYDSLKPIASDNSGQEPEQVTPMVGEKVDGSQRALPTVSIVQRLKDGGETNKQIAARYPEFFGFNKDQWETVYGRMKAFMKGKYKGNRR